jgi:hypothetical protein
VHSYADVACLDLVFVLFLRKPRSRSRLLGRTSSGLLVGGILKAVQQEQKVRNLKGVGRALRSSV